MMIKFYQRILSQNKSGAVTLVFVLVVLIALIVISIMIMKTTTTETKIFGNERIYTTDLYQVESGLNFVKINFDTIISDPTLYLDNTLAVVGSTSGIKSSAWTNIGLPSTFSGKIKFVKIGKSVNEGNSAILTKEHNYSISVKSQNNAEIEVGIKEIFIEKE